MTIRISKCKSTKRLSQSLDKLEAKEFETKDNAKTRFSRNQNWKISRPWPRTNILSLNCP